MRGVMETVEGGEAEAQGQNVPGNKERHKVANLFSNVCCGAERGAEEEQCV